MSAPKALWNWNSDGVKPAGKKGNIPYPGPGKATQKLPRLNQGISSKVRATNAIRSAKPVGSGKVLASLKKGGKIKKTGVYKLHKGERVLSKKQLSKTMDKVFHGKVK